MLMPGTAGTAQGALGQGVSRTPEPSRSAGYASSSIGTGFRLSSMLT